MTQVAPSAHLLLVSFSFQGHVNPLLRLAKRIASKGVHVTFSSSSDVGLKIAASTGATTAPIGNSHLCFEFFSDGWDPDDPRRDDFDALMSHLRDSWPTAVAGLIRRLAIPVSCIISNPFLPWMLDVAVDMGIRCAVLWPQSCAVFSTYFHYHHGLADFPTVDRPEVTVTLPGLPAMKPDEIPSPLHPNTRFTSTRDAILGQFRSLHKASWVLANTFEDLERDAIGGISRLCRVIPVGPLVQTDISGDLLKAVDCMEWLGAQEKQSVVYVSMGSIVVLSRQEMEEMANGLKDSGWPFLWVVRESSRELLPERFVEETQGRGMVVGWSSQERVLGHGSVGCFVTHCGWNSTLETLSAGVPVVAYPQWGDQVMDAKFLVEVYEVGVRLKAPVVREELARCISEVTTGPGAKEMRRRAAEWKEAVRAAVAEGGYSDQNIQAFLNEVQRRS